MEIVELGLISDTHGLLRSEALVALAGCARVLHAGDVGDPEILTRLATIAPVTAVRGNVDAEPPLAKLPATAKVTVGDTRIYMLHVLDDLGLDPAAAGFSMVLYGHTHHPVAEVRAGVLYVNPGSAGPRRFDLPVTVARVRLGDGAPSVRHIDLLALHTTL